MKPLLAMAVALLTLPLSAELILPLPTLPDRHDGVTVTALDDGRALVAGGSLSDVGFELFDPATNAFVRSSAPMELPRVHQTATKLPDGRVLIAGGGYRTDGRLGFGYFGDDALEIYDPATDTIARAARMLEARMYQTATLLRDGTVLIAGGMTANVGGFHVHMNVTNGAEIFDPADNSVRAVGPMLEPRSGHTATLLPDGRVLIFGGTTSPIDELYDPATTAFTPLTLGARTGHAATLLRDGRVLIAGSDVGDPSLLIAADLSGATPVNLGPRAVPTSTLLPDGTVLVFGGAADARVFDPSSDTVVRTLSIGAEPRHHDAALLRDGRVLVVGDGAWLYSRGNLRRRAVR
jgi:hypothetical protein